MRFMDVQNHSNHAPRRRFMTALAALAVVTLGLAPVASVAAPRSETAVLAGGCFWGMEAVFSSLRGVIDVTSGYSGGSRETAHYDDVSTGTTGHAESVRIRFDPAQISYATLLDVFFKVAHDPTERDRQGPDDGSQYRSAIFYLSDEQRRDARAAIAALTAAKTFSAPIVTEVVAYHAFYPAEAYHQHFAERNPYYPYIVINDAPKVAALRARFPDLVKPKAS
jgi:peptide-methionine (S)-S-oxide reductase